MKTILKTKIVMFAILTLLSTTATAENNPKLTQEEKCLAMSIYYEARGESAEGQYAVADVVLNRVDDQRFPDTICDVIKQKNQFHWKKVLPKSNASWHTAKEVAMDILSNETHRGITDGAIFFQRSSRVPPYADERTKQIGNHNFFL
jgi:spore germination cell wall hydrolase CwlJ-like protein